MKVVRNVTCTSSDDQHDDDTRRPRIAIAHDYLTQRGGAEKVVLSLSRAFPEATIYTLLYDPSTTYDDFLERTIVTSPINRLRFIRKNHRAALPILPFAASALKIDADVVIMSSSGWSHGFRSSGFTIAYCHSPARWLYMGDVYLGSNASWTSRLGLWLLGPLLRYWDRRAASSIDMYFANSCAVRDRILGTYGIDATVLHAPVESPGHGLEVQPRRAPAGPFFLCVSRLLVYKNVEQVVEAFRGMPHQLVVVGRGPELERLEAVKSENVVMLQDLSNAEMGWLYRNCTGVVSASYEDYGLTPIEGGLRGKPSAVLRFGGFLDTVQEGVSGVFFDAPTPDSIRAAISEIAAKDWDETKIIGHFNQFSEDTFVRKIREIVQKAVPVAVPDNRSR